MLGVALVGAGRVGGIRAGVVRNSIDARLRVVADVERGRAEALAQVAGAEALADWRAAVAHRDVAIVIVATPTKFHREIAIASLEAGKHVLCEKPLGRSAEEAEEMVEAAQRAQRILWTGFNYRYLAHVRKAKELIMAGKLGPLYFLRSRYGHGGRPSYETAWCTDAELSGGGVLQEQGIHILDQVRFLLGEPLQILAQVQRYFWNFPAVEDNCFCLVKTKAGQIAQLHVSWTQWINVLEMEIYGRDGYLRLEGRDGYYGPPRLIWGSRKPDHSRPSEEHFQFPAVDDSWEREWCEFLNCVRAETNLSANGLDGLRAQQMVDAAYRSARSQSWVEIHSPETQTVRQP